MTALRTALRRWLEQLARPRPPIDYVWEGCPAARGLDL
jgi:hypothetical protein